MLIAVLNVHSVVMSSHRGLESDSMQLPFTREKYVFPDELVSSCSKLLAFTG